MAVEDDVRASAQERLAEINRQINALYHEQEILISLIGPRQWQAQPGLDRAIREYLKGHADPIAGMHYRTLALALDVGPAALLTRLHRLSGVKQVRPRSGFWKAVG